MSPDIVVQEFSKAVDAGNAAVFVGAGISKGADYPDWKGLIQEIASKLELPIGEDLISVVQFAVNQSRNRAVVNQVIVETFSQSRPIPETLQTLAKLPIRTIWTTNYDRLIESSLDAVRKKVDVKIRQADLARTIPGRDVVLYKMHGDYQNPDDVVLSHEDYEDYQLTRPLFTDCLTSDLLDKTFLFLGVGFGDPNLNWLLGRIRSLYGQTRFRADLDYDFRFACSKG